MANTERAAREDSPSRAASLCPRCGEPLEEGVRGCRICRRLYQRKRRIIARESIETFAGHILARCRERIVKACKRGHQQDINIDDAWVVAQWDKQRGRCFYSGVPMTLGHGPCLVTVERLDCEVGYTVDNCVLASQQVNMMRRRTPISEFVWWCQQVSMFAPEAPTPPA